MSSDQGFQLFGLLGPKRVTPEVPTAAAKCEATESNPMKNLASLIRAANSNKFVFPPRLMKLLLVRLEISSI